MKIAIVTTYPPRQCGIGVFTHNLVNAITHNGSNQHEIIIIAMNDFSESYSYPPEVKRTIAQEQQSDYLKAADFINQSGADVCILEHEFGIFGGQSGVYILSLMDRLNIPLVSTLHTILKNPSYTEKEILKLVCKMSDKLVVMTKKAIEFLEDIYDVASEKIVRIEHGVPDIHFDKKESRIKLKLNRRKVILTFGFVSRNKGIETVIKALPHVMADHPDVLYVVLGKTHPNVQRTFGEAYRKTLQNLVKTLKLENHVLFLNEFVDERELFRYLAASDIYITPYLSEAQITSGTLMYAMGAGCVVVSTPYWHAAELLSGNNGRLFDFKDSDGLAIILNELFEDPNAMQTIERQSEAYGRGVVWSKIGKKYINLLELILAEPMKIKAKTSADIDLFGLPPFSLTHIKRLTDDTGIMQHAKFGIPNRKEGYCLDDNARALLMASMAYKQKKSTDALAMMPVYLGYIHYMQNSDGTFRNFLSFNRNYLDEVGSEDSFGRTIWALGHVICNAPIDAYYQAVHKLFLDAAPNFEKLKSLRGIANTIIGLCFFLKKAPTNTKMTATLQHLTQVLMAKFKENRLENWNWFETRLTYDNGILPLALLHAGEVLENEKVKNVGFETMDFLSSHTLKDGHLSVIGNNNWFEKGEKRAMYAQQPIDAMAVVLMYHQAYVLTGKRMFLQKLFTSFRWFLGENDLRMSLYDFETKGCCDGFETYGVNRNQGAESTLAYLISQLTVLQAYEESFQFSERKKKLKPKRRVTMAESGFKYN